MEKRAWISPVCEMVKFAADEYIAACGDSGTVYYFECENDKNLPSSGKLYFEDNQQPGWQSGGRFETGGDTLVKNKDGESNFSWCNTTHQTESNSAFEDGYFVANNTATEVILWIVYGWDRLGNKYIENAHATTNLNMNTWETAKS